MTASFDKKLAELDAYLQMLIEQSEKLDKKIELASNELEINGLKTVKNNLETLLGSIKHAIVLLQIAKVSIRTGDSDNSNTSCNQTYSQQATKSTQSFSSLSTSTVSSGSSGDHSDKYQTVKSNTTAATVTLASPTAGSQQNLAYQAESPQPPARSGKRRTQVQQRHSQDQSKQEREQQQQQLQPQQQQQPLQQPASQRHLSDSSSSLLLQQTSQQIQLQPRPQPLQQPQPQSLLSKSRKARSPSDSYSQPLPQSPIVKLDKCATSVAGYNADCESGGAKVPSEEEGIITDDDEAFYDAADEHNQSMNLIATETTKKKLLPSSSIPESPTNSEANTMANNISESNNNNNIVSPVEDGSIDWDALYDEGEEQNLESFEGQGSVIKHLISQVRIGMDLTKITLPTFILERRSLLEMYADFFAHPDLFSSITDYNTPEERMIQIVRWYVSAFHAGKNCSIAKKPYNPILGEIFTCDWKLKEDDSKHQSNLRFIAEQVSHHPPVSAFYAENQEKEISCCAHIYTKSKYLGLSVGVHNIGHGEINLHKHKEKYIVTFPSAYGRSILTVPWIELGGSVDITCEQTGYSANLEFVTKPFYGGKKHRVIGQILRPNKEPFLAIDGEWNGVMYSKCPPNSSDKQVFVDTTCLPVIKKHVRPISSQESLESRNVWKEVTRALKLRDVSSATAAKSFIEQRQRDLLKDRQEKGAKWKTRYFEPTGDGWTYSKSAE